jgi:hypothetical protein
MFRDDAHLVDPKLGRFVGMHVVNTRGKSDDASSETRNSDMVPWIVEKLRDEVGLHWRVE